MARHEGLRLPARADLVWRSFGALVHALWLRKEEWSFAVIAQDVRYAMRGLSHRPGFAVLAIAMLAVGIGANAAMFSVVRAVLLEPLPFHEPARLVQVWETNPLRNWTHNTLSPANLIDIRSRSRSFSSIAFYFGSDTKGPGLNDVTLTGAGDPERIRGMTVSDNFFATLGVAPLYGRTFAAEEARPGANGVVVIDHGFWQRRFGGDPSVVGRRLELNGNTVEVIGVMPAAFSFPGADPDYWGPFAYDEARLIRLRRPHYLRAVARLAPGVTLEQARGDVTAIMGALEREYPDTNTRMGAGVGLLHDWFVGDYRRALVLLMAAVGGVLLIACANVASLLLARASSRRRELAIRSALGAGTLRLFRQLLIESGLLAIAAAVLGAGIAAVAIAWLRANGPADVPRVAGMTLDPIVLGFLGVISLATALIFGVAPAWLSVRRPPSAALQDGSRSATAAGTRLRRLLIGAEVALAVVLLVGAGLIARSFAQLRSVDPGIDVSHAVSFRMTLPGIRYDQPAKVATFYAAALESLRQTSGVRAAGATARLALDGYLWTSDLHIEGRPTVAGRELRHKTITTGFLEAAGIPVLSGRDFTAADAVGAMPVVLVNETLARTYFGGGEALGQRLTFGQPGPTTIWRTVVGVVADEKQDALSATVMPEVYEAHAQDPRTSMAVIVRATGDPLALVPAIRRTVAGLDDKLALYDIRTLEQLVDRSLAVERFATLVLTSFAAGALLLAAIGLYGVIAFTVATRTREIGLRLALGASRAAVLWMVVWEGLSVVLAGLVVGLPLALLLSRGVRAFLFQTPPADPVVLIGVGVVLLFTGTLASYLPALRASRVDPAISLRND